MAETTEVTGSVLYSEEVSADTLNNIAVDLGCSELSKAFVEGGTYTVDELNQLTADLVSKGILNIGNRCKVSLSGNTISVASGVCVFGDGSKARLTSSKSVNFIEGSTNYVYLAKKDNKISLVNTVTQLTTEYEDYVKLAEISSDGVVSDKRTYAISKTAYASNVITELVWEVPSHRVESPPSAEFIVAPERANYIIVKPRHDDYSGHFIALPLTEGQTVSVKFESRSFYYITLNGGVIGISISYNGRTGNPSGYSETFYVV